MEAMIEIWRSIRLVHLTMNFLGAIFDKKCYQELFCNIVCEKIIMNTLFSILVPHGSPETNCITEKSILKNTQQITGLLSYDRLPSNHQ